MNNEAYGGFEVKVPDNNPVIEFEFLYHATIIDITVRRVFVYNPTSSALASQPSISVNIYNLQKGKYL